VGVRMMPRGLRCRAKRERLTRRHKLCGTLERL
jgi:hypothetical protein